MEHEVILLIGMAAAFILGAKIKELRLPRVRGKEKGADEAAKHEDMIQAQMRGLLSYTIDDYKKQEDA